MQTTIPVAYILLIAAAVAVVVFYIVWSRRSTPTRGRRDRHTDQGNHTQRSTNREEG